MRPMLAAARVQRRFLQSSAALLAVALAHLLFPAPAAALYITGCEAIQTSRMTPQYGDRNLLDNAGNRGPFGPYGWNVSYTRCFDGAQITKNLAIDFIFDARLGYTQEQESAYKWNAAAGVESIWNGKFFVSDITNNMLFPAVLDISTAGLFDQTVQVFRTGDLPRGNMINWNDSFSSAIMAHEVGHMLGLFDEYIGGAVDRFPDPTLSHDGLMGLGALLPYPVMYERYYHQYADFMNTLNAGIGQFVLLRVGEPGSLPLLALAVLLWLRIGKIQFSRSLGAPLKERCRYAGQSGW